MTTTGLAAETPVASDPGTRQPKGRSQRPRAHGREEAPLPGSRRWVEALFDDIVGLVEGLRGEHEELRRRQSSGAPDGYPTSSLCEGGSPTNWVDEDGATVAQHSDPVGELVAGRDEPGVRRSDAVRRALVGLVEHAVRARQELEFAASSAAQVHPPLEVDEAMNSRDWCWNCLRCEPVVFSPTWRDSSDPERGIGPQPRCRHCYEWWQLYRGDSSFPSEQPRGLVVRRVERGKVTAADREAVVAEWRKERGR